MLISFLYNPKTCTGYAVQRVHGEGERLIKYRTDPKTGAEVCRFVAARRPDYAMSAAVNNRGRFPRVDHVLDTEIW